MESIIIILPLLVALYFVFNINQKKQVKSSIIKIDDKNWIVNNELVSFEKDTLLLRMKQEQEDNRIYREYERGRYKDENDVLYREWERTNKAINKFPDLLECVTDEKLEAITEKYNKYLSHCNKLDVLFKLTKEQYLIREENPALCRTVGTFISYVRNGYSIYNEKTARYLGPTNELLKKKYELKYY